jgi:glycosyltransferase involved in cell wall biosynthesis
MVAHAYFPLDPRVAREARAAQAAGWDVDVLAMRRDGEPSLEIVEGIRVRRLPITHNRGRGFGRLLVEYCGFTAAATSVLALRAAVRRYNVVQIHNPPDFLILAAIIPKLLGARVLFDVHDLSPDMLDMRFRGRPWADVAERAMRYVEHLATRLADAVITVHEPYRAELVHRGVESEKIVVVMNSVDEDLLPDSTPAADAAFRIVYHGTVAPHYGVEILVEAAAIISARHTNVRVEIYGDGDAVDEVRAVARRRGVSDRVVVTGERIGQRDVLARVAGASVGVIPNRPTRLDRFALSSKLFEYVVLGIPAVSADLPTIRAHFGPTEVRFFEAGNAKRLAEALLDVAQNPEAAMLRAAAARRRYENDYSWTLNAKRYVDTLARLLDSRPRQRISAKTRL